MTELEGFVWAAAGAIGLSAVFFFGAWYGRRSARPYDSWPIVTDESASLRAQVGFQTHCLTLCQETSRKRLAAIHRLQDELRQVKSTKREAFLAEAQEAMAREP